MPPYIDPRARDRGIEVVTRLGSKWALQSLTMITDPEGNGGRHHIYITTLSEKAQVVEGHGVRFFWASGSYVKFGVKKDDGKLIYVADMGMYAGGNSYSVEMLEGSDVVTGMGLGLKAYPPDGTHLSYRLIFQERAGVPMPPGPTPPPTPKPDKDEQLLVLIDRALVTLDQAKKLIKGEDAP